MQYRFGEYVLDVDEHRLLRNGVEVRLRGKVFDTLRVLVKSGGKLILKDEILRQVWPDAVVEENNLDHCVSQLRKIFGEQGKRFIETVPRQGYRFTCPVQGSDPSGARPAQRFEPPALPEQKVEFFRASDGVSIAYSKCGNGPPLVKAANWLNHLEFEWQSPLWGPWVSELTRHHTVYRYDERGNGMSDWNIQDFSFASWVRDLEGLIDTVKLDKFALLGISQGGAVAISYAARFPERVSKLVLYGAFPQGILTRNRPVQVEQLGALLTLMRLGWGKGNPAFRQMWTTIFMPEATPEQAEWFNELQRVTTSPENAVQLIREIGKIDVLDLLPKVQCPTLVIHCNRDAAISISQGRLLAARIPRAKFVELPSRNHLVIPQEPAWDVFVNALGEFLEWDKDEIAAAAESRRS